MIVYLDIHILVWLYYGETHNLTVAARAAIEDSDLIAPSVALLEMELLHEMGRTRHTASAIIATLEAKIGLRVCDCSLRDVATHALKENWTRDPFDRLIVANAKAADASLISKDERILKHYRRAIW